MKKTYLLALALGAFVFSANAQFSDDFESHPLGTLHEGPWSSWSGMAGPEDVIVSDEYAFSGGQSGQIAGSTTQDCLLLLGNKTTGSYTLSFQMYIPAGKSGYYNFQGTTDADGSAFGTPDAGIFNSPNLVFNNVLSASGAPGLGGAYLNVDSATAEYTWGYPEDQWFPVSIVYDIDGGLWTMTINGSEIPAQPMDAENVVGGIDFYSFDANNEYYVDDVAFVDNSAGVNDFSADAFSVYPNPVKDVLNISSKASVDAITVYDILGKVVYSAQPGTMSPTINMSSFASGAYLVKVAIGNATKTIQVIK